jgi:hypothetical protein
MDDALDDEATASPSRPHHRSGWGGMVLAARLPGAGRADRSWWVAAARVGFSARAANRCGCDLQRDACPVHRGTARPPSSLERRRAVGVVNWAAWMARAETRDR